ncbi:lasso peptide biosynthesis PqqD family chaperone [Paenibacillus mendelii]|uniref:Lasso peptide biosynthesis PqqD family chaperone n=1 Tax=Paenibacillus mendelii TaxID=206163 RepID=A0ABV6JJ70_9BACL|nr:lasso peptide biosynthesis PqqD family chaperone [Paenibacillus mendelii]MCQ6558882.1 lasso peptide biosynthesis PqqD family chaperone [Paenibacillus mendelii]
MKDELITTGHIIGQTEDTLVSNMDQDKVMMSIQTGKYYNLGAIGGRIWDIIETPTTVGRLVEVLTLEFDVNQTVCEEQVIIFLNKLLKEQLIVVKEEASVNL